MRENWPWDNEITPIVDADEYGNAGNGFIPAKTGRSLERRMRSAESLLGEVDEHLGWSFDGSPLHKRIDAQLAAAREEDQCLG